MTYTNVASCVISIVGSFASGLDVFKKLKEKRRRRKRSKKLDCIDEEELRLSRSLRRGPEDIGREYQRSVYAAGQGFEIGDVVAQTSLAEIILRLNTGLVSIITSFLDHDKKGVQLDYQSLTDLSEQSRIDTCRTLRQLFKRMTAQPARPLRIDPGHTPATDAGRPSKDVGKAGRHKARPAPVRPTRVRRPMIAQVVIENSSKPPQLAIVKPSERRKKSSSSSSSSLSKASSACSSGLSTPLPTPPPQYTPHHLPRPAVQRTQTAPDITRSDRKRSAAAVPQKAPLRATQSTPWLEATLSAEPEPTPPAPNPAAMSTVDVLPRRRKPTPTYYSIASDQTKIGEVPLHKWPEPYDFDQMSVLNKEAYSSGWPLNQLSAAETKKKRFGFGKLFGKKASA